jgi:MEDS: MEthanogen/methylotroph, DcmR Sensory domain
MPIDSEESSAPAASPVRLAAADFGEVFVSRSNSRAKRVGKAAALRRPKSEAAEQSPAGPVLRKSGIRVIGDVPWGDHLCIFYETREDLLDTAASYFAAGLQSNEFCVWAISDQITQADAKDALRLAVPDLDRPLAAGRMEILPGSEWYLKGDQFDPKRVTSGWNEKLQGALAKGYEGMRVSGDTFWIETNHWKAFCEYEQELDRSLANRKMIALFANAWRWCKS